MYQHILTPLDGSSLAEIALPAAAYFAQAFQARVTLLHVIEQRAAATVHGERHLTGVAEAETYLRKIAQTAFPTGTNVTCHVHDEATRNVSQAIAEHEGELSPDFLIMATHDQSYAHQALFGNIAQQVAAFGELPLLLVRAPIESRPSAFTCKHILAPTDGEAHHESGLAVACKLAQHFDSALHLLSVVPTVGNLSGSQALMQRFMPGTTATMLEIAEVEFRNYLNEQLDRLQQYGVSASAEVKRGDPATVIAETAEIMNASLIVLGTHGRAGTNAFWRNSVGANVILRSKRPVLLIPVKESCEK
ncbi:UspA domain protein [Candidatus Moduliflexus flocculans]|uniref:UspA domain protein n=1 Tax=Candidatus Moduliflexus flocculans TaxID=1499966 RepID=A0A0S6VV28_9BACT|nr:UspA domain protein [Candidatus Moduliflexus flocculans]